MDEEELESKSNQETSIAVDTSLVKESKLDSLSRYDDFFKSEKEVKPIQQIKGVETVKDNLTYQDKSFKRKEEEKRVYIKRRLKILTGVYVCILVLLLTFTGVNFATMISDNSNINNNKLTIIEQEVELPENISEIGKPVGEEIGESAFISLNEPRDYSDDYKELTFLDKLTILLRNLFG